MDRLEESLDEIKDAVADVLEVACHTGTMVSELAQYGAVQIRTVPSLHKQALDAYRNLVRPGASPRDRERFAGELDDYKARLASVRHYLTPRAMQKYIRFYVDGNFHQCAKPGPYRAAELFQTLMVARIQMFSIEMMHANSFLGAEDISGW